MMTTPFFKMHGLGNDFMVVDARGAPEAGRAAAAAARALGDRRRGVGFDQLIVLEDALEPGAAARVSFWNSDGGASAACGNGARCAAELLMRERGDDLVTLETAAGQLACRRLDDETVEVDMGAPRLDWREIPLAEASLTERIDVKLGPIDAPALWGPGAVNMGNPHCVFFVDDADQAPVDTLGPFIENHPMFPERTNVEFAEIRAPDLIRARVWERGAGRTLACGTGACAVVVAAARRGLAERRATVRLDGGDLSVFWSPEDDRVRLAGPTRLVFAGALADEFVAAAGAP